MLPHRGSPPAPRSCARLASAQRLSRLTERDTPKGLDAGNALL